MKGLMRISPQFPHSLQARLDHRRLEITNILSLWDIVLHHNDHRLQYSSAESLKNQFEDHHLTFWGSYLHLFI